MPELSNNNSLTEETKDFLSYQPRGVLKYGNISIATLFAICLVLSFLISYPDQFFGELTIQRGQGPVRHEAIVSSQVQDIHATSGQFVTSGSPIVSLVGTISIDQYDSAIAELQYLRHVLVDSIVFLPLTHSKSLKGFENDVATLEQALMELLDWNQDGTRPQKQMNLKAQINLQSGIKRKLESELVLRNQEVGIAQVQFSRDSSLHQKGAISKQELETARVEFLQAKRSIAQLERSIIQSQLTIEQLNNRIIEFRSINDIGDNDSKHAVLSAIASLEQRLNLWKDQYVVEAAIDGVLVYDQLEVGLHVSPGNTVFSVMPVDSSVSCRVNVAETGYGKLAIGQEVIITLNEFPSGEYGELRGVISDLEHGQVSENGQYTVGVEIPTFITTIDKTIRLDGELTGTAMMITDNRKVIERIINIFS